MDYAMKARIQGTDTSILLTHAYPGRMKQIDVRANSIARVKAQLLACYAVYARITCVNMLKVQVDAGKYIVDSQTIARKIRLSPVMRDLPEYEIDDTSLPTQERTLSLLDGDNNGKGRD
jgi:hypothetical protein